MQEEAKRLHDDLMNDPALQDALRDVFEKGTPEEQVKAANELGYSVSLEDVRRPGLEAVDDDELEAVSGGALFFGDYAADGKEIGCWCWNYENEKEAEFKCCPKGNSRVGFDHNFEEIKRTAYTASFLGHKDQLWHIKYVCKRCGYVYTT